MKRTILAFSLPLLAASAFAGNMKAGLWEVKTIRQLVDGQDMQEQMQQIRQQMEQQMANLPPAQRQQMEAMMGSQGVGISTGGAARICISEETAKRAEPIVDPKGQCQPNQMNRSGNTVSYEIDCDIDGHHAQGKGESTFSGDTITSRMDMTTTDTTGSHTLQNESQMTYLGPDCRGLPPR